MQQCVFKCVQKRWAQKEKEMREQMKKLKSGPSTSEYSSFHGKERLLVTEVVFVWAEFVISMCDAECCLVCIVSLTLSVLMSIKVNMRGRVLKSTKVDVQGSSALTIIVDKSRHSFVVLCSKGLYIHIQHWEQNKKIYSAPRELTIVDWHFVMAELLAATVVLQRELLVAMFLLKCRGKRRIRPNRFSPVQLHRAFSPTTWWKYYRMRRWALLPWHYDMLCKLQSCVSFYRAAWNADAV